MAQQPWRFSQLLVSTARSFGQSTWQPAVDVYRAAGGWLLKYELAGVSPQDIEVHINGRTISVQGVRRDLWIEESQQSYSMEIAYNQFHRALELPCDLSTMDVATQYRDGMLLVRLTPREPCA